MNMLNRPLVIFYKFHLALDKRAIIFALSWENAHITRMDELQN